ncbi:tyrosine-type recombinase/integrase [Pirellulales bacterium]|nr:tyrosine-type recombinase/integrase [Pirellulales bacterium]
MRSAFTDAEKAGLRKWQSEHRWSPNQLRHTAGTAICKRFGLEAAQVILGHSNANVTQVYAERDLDKAVAVAREVG